MDSDATCLPGVGVASRQAWPAQRSHGAAHLSADVRQGSQRLCGMLGPWNPHSSEGQGQETKTEVTAPAGRVSQRSTPLRSPRFWCWPFCQWLFQRSLGKCHGPYLLAAQVLGVGLSACGQQDMVQALQDDFPMLLGL